MTKEELLEKLLRSYRQSFDLECPYTVHGEKYDAYGAFNVTSAKYVLTKKAELWRAQCYEHAFFKLTEEFSGKDLEAFSQQITEYIEPEMVWHGEKCPPPNHMYTYITGVFICDSVEEQARKQIRKFKFMKNYRFTIRGYCDARIVVFDLKNKKLYGNGAAREIIKGYKKIL